ncbi:MAG: Rsd/AlgQ family anti-sigma factor [Gammaproteobacteria bacterium]|nr:Rsd/AlgQ family anti-sigma factor [Gammaproteobacteria bacterium]
MSHSNIESIAKAAKKITKENERRSRILDVIDELLEERQQMLVCFCEVAGLDSADEETQNVLAQLRHLNQLLVDYSALGHFEIYNRIIDGKERREAANKVADKVYGDIERTTEIFVAFNDKYEGADSEDSITDLHQDLSKIGECLALRIDGEDQLLKELGKR